MDEISAVFVRRAPENEPLIERFPLNCATAALPARPPGDNRAEAFNAWANAASVLQALGRNSEALAATIKGWLFCPTSVPALDPRQPAVRGRSSRRVGAGIPESHRARAQRRHLGSAGTFVHEAWPEFAAADAMEHEARLSPRPYLRWNDLGYLYLQLNQPENAATAFNKAAASTPSALKAADNGFFEFKVAQGRAAAAEALGNSDRAIAYQEEAASLEPNVSAPWRRLAKMYERAGRSEDATRARQHAADVEKQQH